MQTLALRRPTLELPVFPIKDFRPPSRRALEEMIEWLIAMLDDLDGDCDTEIVCEDEGAQCDDEGFFLATMGGM